MTNQKKNAFYQDKTIAKDIPNKNNNKNEPENMKPVYSLFKCGGLW